MEKGSQEAPRLPVALSAKSCWHPKDSPAFLFSPYSVHPRRRPGHRGPVAAEGKVPAASFSGLPSGEGGHSFPQRPLGPSAGTVWIAVQRGPTSALGAERIALLAEIHHIGQKGEEAMPVPASFAF